MNESKTFKIFVFFLSVLSCFRTGSAQCGYESCHPVKEDEINIHLVPHTHDDLGWLKTVDQYYYGTRQDVYPAGVQYILDDVIEALKKNSDRRFIYVEMGFFFKWWPYQSEEIKNVVKNLVENGQLEFISGGWSMNDEASAYYQTIIDQMSLGLRRLNETFGECGRPKVAWQIDPFGHSREMASIFAQLGFDGFFLNRIDYEDLADRKANREMEFVWRGSPNNLGESTDIYTNVLFRHYSAPSGLCFDAVLCNDDSIVDDINSTAYNVKQKAEDFITNWVVPASKAYSSNNLLVPMGDDFNYQYAEQYFDNIDKLIKYINERKSFDGVNYNIIYSTPSCYLNAVYQATNGVLDAPLKTDDFFPYASSGHNYWTGYFSSRPTGKGFSRYANNFLQVCKQLGALTNVSSSDETQLNVLREALGVFQHHDGITGTEKENVAHDYIKLVHNGIVECEKITNKVLFHLIEPVNMTFTTCPMLNISECARTENEDRLVITIYNPLGRAVNKWVRLPIVDNTTEIIITDPSGTQLQTQIFPISPQVITVPGRTSSAKFKLIFRADDIPPLGFKSFFFEKSSKETYDNFETSQEKTDDADFNHVQVDSSSGSKMHVQNINEDMLYVWFDFYYYTGFVGNDSSDEFSSSNPYVFRPDPDIPLKSISSSCSCASYVGNLGGEFQCYCNEWLSYVWSLYDNVVEFNYLVGPLPYDQQGVEVIVKFTTNLEYDDKIYTDVNGREIIERIRDYRPTWNVTVTEPVAGNYYPVVSGVTLKNANGTAEVAFLTDRANGGGSLDYQSVEFMIHRNTIRTGGGVGEALNEQAFGTGVVSRGSHYLLFRGTDYSPSSAPTPKEVSQEIYLDSWIFFASPNGETFDQYRQGHVMEFSGLTNITLPKNVNILTLEPWGPSTLLLRLENFVGKEDTLHSGTSTVNVQELFSTFDILTIRETTLGANQWLDENIRIKFNQINAEERIIQNIDDFSVTLEPMQIRTFILTITYK